MEFIFFILGFALVYYILQSLIMSAVREDTEKIVEKLDEIQSILLDIKRHKKQKLNHLASI
ncbi:ATP synthase subunit B family protein [Dethiobacter alkaliphilus]|uniref:hypothetical protein n=1 Tax=Dethiobacter alkaliphilus TaxID=427926 RepID=UPI002227D223|nr:hypothetical protein [Dethiobacter alkaliphilus]MCW3491548.1 hypothetical protein [Dethiobacter alkaliphilus]